LSFFSFFWDKIAGQEPTPETMYRNTLGTGISNKNSKRYSLTLYAWSLDPLDGQDTFRLAQFFENKMSEFLRSLYPRSNYNISDWWGAQVRREERNAPLDFDPDFIQSYSYEINQEEKEFGDLTNIL